jgi:hypothetical protein
MLEVGRGGPGCPVLDNSTGAEPHEGLGGWPQTVASEAHSKHSQLRTDQSLAPLPLFSTKTSHVRLEHHCYSLNIRKS